MMQAEGRDVGRVVLENLVQAVNRSYLARVRPNGEDIDGGELRGFGNHLGKHVEDVFRITRVVHVAQDNGVEPCKTVKP